MTFFLPTVNCGKYLHVISLISLLLIPLTSTGDQLANNIRRHFLIATDISGPFTSSLHNTPELRNTLTALFNNQIPKSALKKNTLNLETEVRNQVPFFQYSSDRITCFQFGVTEAEITELRKDRNASNQHYTIRHFVDEFIEVQSSALFNTPTKNDVNRYIGQMFDDIPHRGFGKGVSLSNFVYPLVMEQLSSEEYVGEYILIILSDFLTGSEFGNKKDFLRLKDIYRYTYEEHTPPGSAPHIIQDHINNLSNAFLKLQYFEYVFKPGSGKNEIGILAFKIKPRAGKAQPEDISMFIDGNLELKQNGFNQPSYRLSETQLRFTHNEQLDLQELVLSLATNLKEDSIRSYSFHLAQREDGQKWTSPITSSYDLMQLDSNRMSYNLPSIADLALHEGKLGNVGLTYTLKAHYHPLENSTSPVGYSFKTSRSIPADQVAYKAETSQLVTLYGLPILITLILFGLLIRRASPKKISIPPIHPLSESFEEINYYTKAEGKPRGRYVLPYLRWTNNDKYRRFEISGTVHQGNWLFRKLWRVPLSAILIREKSTPGFETYLRNRHDEIAALNDELTIQFSQQGHFAFEVLLEKTDSLYELRDHQRFEFSVEVFYQRSFFAFSKRLKSNVLHYNYYVGPDLGNIWVGIDPGTSGSCITAGADGMDDLFIPKDKDGSDLIIPSVIAFLKDVNNEEMKGEALPYRDKRYYYGKEAEQNVYRTEYGVESFRSIKKMLGFADEKELHFTKDPEVTYSLNGKELCSLLVRGVYDQMDSQIKKSQRTEFLRNGSFIPKRAVVAIPNNFTAHRIQDITDSLRELQQFAEIRCIYEAEANLMYHLFNKKTLDRDGIILLFDMGGATINVTSVHLTRNKASGKTIYEIDILGKLGYGIGGDTIDYILIKHISQHLDSFGVYVNPFDFKKNSDLKEKLVRLAFRLKLQIIENFEKDKSALVDNTILESYINEAFGVKIFIPTNHDIMTAFTRKNGIYPLFQEELMQELLYNNIRSIVKDVEDMCQYEIDHIIFSGRSVVFPLVQYTVIQSLNQPHQPATHKDPNLDKLKSAVAIGACLYGMNRSRIILNTTKVNSWFGIKEKTDASNFELIPLVKLGTSFEKNDNGLNQLSKREFVESDFGFDGGVVNFFQVMSSTPIKAFKKGEKHKYSLLQQARINTMTESVGMEVWENDEVFCKVKEKGTHPEKKYNLTIKDHEVSDANEEHYTWIIK